MGHPIWLYYKGVKYVGMEALKQPMFWKIMGAVGLVIAAPLAAGFITAYAIDKIADRKKRR